MMKNKIILCFLSIFVMLISCKKDQQSEVNVHNKGSLTIVTDDAFKNIAEALAEAYMLSYPNTKIEVKVQKEDLALLGLLKRENQLIIMSRNMTEAEKKEYKRQIDMEVRLDPFAVDAVVFVVPKDDERTQISVEEIRKELASDAKNIIFDGTNSSNLNFVAQKLNKKASDLKFSTISGNENVILELSKYPNKIGVVSMNTFSRPYGKEALKLRESVKILSVVDDGKSYEPTFDNLRTVVYPFTRVLNLVTNERTFGISNGFIRFSCMQLGQIVVSKEGLQPYYLFKREVEMR